MNIESYTRMTWNLYGLFGMPQKIVNLEAAGRY